MGFGNLRLLHLGWETSNVILPDDGLGQNPKSFILT
jgi:hypothetical protein